LSQKWNSQKRPSKIDQQGGIVAYQDDDNYIKLVYNNAKKGFLGGDEFIELVVENHGYQYSAANIKTIGLIKDNYTIVFKLEKKGSRYTAYYSIGGKDFMFLGSTDAVLSNVQTGLITCEGVDIAIGDDIVSQIMAQMERKEEPKFEVKYDYFHIINTGLK